MLTRVVLAYLRLACLLASCLLAITARRSRTHTPYDADLVRFYTPLAARLLQSCDEAAATMVHGTATAPTPNLSGRRVRIFSLKPKP